MPTHQTSNNGSWSTGVTAYQWLVLFVAWLGWVFDAMDATIYAIVLHPALHDLLSTDGSPPTTEQVGWYGGLIFSIFLIGWAIGGITFGVFCPEILFGSLVTLLNVIIDRSGESVESCASHLVVWADDHRTTSGAPIFRLLGHQEGHLHEILIPMHTLSSY